MNVGPVGSLAAPVRGLSGPAAGSGSVGSSGSSQPVSGGSPVPALPCSVSLSAAQRLFEQIHQDGIQGGVQVLHELHIFSRLTHSCHIFYYNIFCFV